MIWLADSEAAAGNPADDCTIKHGDTACWQSLCVHRGISHDGLRRFHTLLIHGHVGGHLPLDQPPELSADDDTDDDEMPELIPDHVGGHLALDQPPEYDDDMPDLVPDSDHDEPPHSSYTARGG